MRSIPICSLQLFNLDESDACFGDELNYPGNDRKYVYKVTDPKECQRACEKESFCNFWTLKKFSKICILKDKRDIEHGLNPGVISGPKNCPLMSKIHHDILLFL